MAHAADMLLDLFALPSEPLVFPTGRLQGLLSLLQARGVLWGPARFALGGLVIGGFQMAL